MLDMSLLNIPVCDGVTRWELAADVGRANRWHTEVLWRADRYGYSTSLTSLANGSIRINPSVRGGYVRAGVSHG